ncbi:UNVERIFIED_CONTAM: hypothetical protein HDU68_012362 [Siphonaria sp. JEL0065]|nr:hypothetical protein HDU68_012362 [Siphonaria sp. JEL0065]
MAIQFRDPPIESELDRAAKERGQPTVRGYGDSVNLIVMSSPDAHAFLGERSQVFKVSTSFKNDPRSSPFRVTPARTAVASNRASESDSLYNAMDRLAFSISLDTLWPDLWLPVEFHSHENVGFGKLPMFKPLELVGQDLEMFHELIKLVMRYGGSVKVQIYSIGYWNAILPILPPTVDLYVAADRGGFYQKYDGEDAYEEVLAAVLSSKIRVRKLALPELDENHWWHAEPIETYVDTAAFIEVAKCAKVIQRFGNTFPSSTDCDQLIKCTTLEVLEFDWVPPFDMDNYSPCFDLIERHPTLRRITFEVVDRSDEITPHDGAGLSKFGWEWYRGTGGLYGNPCIIWAKSA